MTLDQMYREACPELAAERDANRCIKCGEARYLRRRCRHCKAVLARRYRQSGRLKTTTEQKRRRNARSYLHVYVKRGVVKKQPCYVCGSTWNIEAHHEDYSKPLAVDWLCRIHHSMVTHGELCLLR